MHTFCIFFSGTDVNHYLCGFNIEKGRQNRNHTGSCFESHSLLLRRWVLHRHAQLGHGRHAKEREGMAWLPGTGDEVLIITQGFKPSVRGRLHENSASKL